MRRKGAKILVTARVEAEKLDPISPVWPDSSLSELASVEIITV